DDLCLDEGVDFVERALDVGGDGKVHARNRRRTATQRCKARRSPTGSGFPVRISRRSAGTA
ncbi:MAG: hypothetical protein ACKOQ1_05085, partial [Actinomycetota bacterium]